MRIDVRRRRERESRSHVRIACAVNGCGTGQDSRYAELLGIPVSALGLAAFVVIGMTALTGKENVRLAAASLAIAGVVFSGYLVVMQAAVIDAFRAGASPATL
jgi:uncharacterized membrane protein